MNLYLLEAVEGPAPGRTHEFRVFAEDMQHARRLAEAHARCHDTDPVDWISVFETYCTLLKCTIPFQTAGIALSERTVRLPLNGEKDE